MDEATCQLLQHEPHFLARFMPRPEYKGHLAMSELLKHSGSVLKVRLLWKMGDDDPYPGEWAVGSGFDDEPELLGRTWIASGDFTLFWANRRFPQDLPPPEPLP